jgi:pimeloyl-ACP methyl ester carboxylesterase
VFHRKQQADGGRCIELSSAGAISSLRSDSRSQRISAVLIEMEAPRPAVKARVIALACSGSSGSQWRPLAEALGRGREFLTPEHAGPAIAARLDGRAFTLADEAQRCTRLIDASERKVHLVGHSYGGAVALQAALARPERIASMTLYEPAAFHLLDELGGDGAAGFVEIAAIARRVRDAVSVGEHAAAAAAFVDYWNGQGAWDRLSEHVRAALTRWAAKAPLEFAALMNARTVLEEYAALDMPILVLRGEHAPLPTRVIADALPDAMDCAVEVIAGAGHMGPMTHADAVSARMVAHITSAEAMPALHARGMARRLIGLDAALSAAT